MIHRDVHVEVLDGHVEVTHAPLVLLPPNVQLMAHLLQQSDVVGVFGDAVGILEHVSKQDESGYNRK